MTKLRFNSTAIELMEDSGRNFNAFFAEGSTQYSTFRSARSRGVSVDSFKWIVDEVNALGLTTYDGGPVRFEVSLHGEKVKEFDRSARPFNESQSERAPAVGAPSEELEVAINLRHRRNPFFTGRVQQFERLERELDPSSSKLLAISGLGGVGKTQLALEYAYRCGGRHSKVLWSSADTSTALEDGCYRIAKALGLPVEYADPASAVNCLGDWMGRESGWVLFLDNADHPRVLDQFVPPRFNGHVVLTSRAQNFDRLGETTVIPVDLFSVDESVEFLKRRTRRDCLSTAEESAMGILATKLGNLALALEQAAAFVIETQSDFSHYLRRYEREGLPFLESHRPEAGAYPATVASTWYLNFCEVAKESPASIELLRSAAFLRAPGDDFSVPIPFSYLLDSPEVLISELAPTLRQELLDATDVDDRALRLARILGPLTRFSLASIDRDEKSFSIHPLVIEVVRATPDL